MKAPSFAVVLLLLVQDTFRQALASRVFWVMLAVTLLAVVFCLGIRIEGAASLRPEDDFLYHPKTHKPLAGPATDLGQMTLLFGAMRVPLHRGTESQVQFLHVILGSWVAGSAGLLLTLIWTAGFLPEFLQPGSASVLFAKPTPRWQFLVGKYLGAVVLVAFQALLFFAGTWIALGIKTGMWSPGYLAGIPVLTLHFAAIYSFSALMAVVTRSTVASIMATIFFWVVCCAVNYGYFALAAMPTLAPGVPPVSSLAQGLVEAGYWLFPKPADYLIMLEQALNAESHMATLSSLPEVRALREQGAFYPDLSIFSSLAFAACLLVIGSRQLSKIDY